MTEASQKNVSISIPFTSEEYAQIASDVLCVDKELRGSGVSRQIASNKTHLIIDFEGADVKKLRVAVNSVLKNIVLILKTFSAFE